MNSTKFAVTNFEGGKPMKNFKSGTKWFYWFSLIVAVVIIYKVLDNFTGIGAWISELLRVLKPFLMAILLAYLLYIPCRNIEKIFKKNKFLKKRARGLSVATTYLLAILAIVILVNTIIPIISESVIDLAKYLPGYYDRAIEYVNNLPEDSAINKETVQSAIDKLKAIDITQFFDADSITMYFQKVVGIASGIFNTFVTIVVSVYILLERTEILKFVKRLNSSLFSEKRCMTINRYFIKGNEIFFKYISSQVLDAIIVAVIMSIALTIMGVKYSILLGFIIGLFNLIPYFGAIIAVILAAIITIFTGGISQAIWVVVVAIILQQIDANIINPKIIGDALEISRILIIFSVTVGGAYFGILGMFLGVPIVSVIKMMIDDYIERNENKKVLAETE